MAVVISEIITELAVAPRSQEQVAGAGAAGLTDDTLDAVVRGATERVLEVLRREWDR